jgi:translocator assembly and maintenance protein 41
LPITLNPPDELIEAQNRNLESAVATALLLSPRQVETSISLPTFFSQIASLSYSGDFRMKVGGEDPRKISKLVNAPGQLERFQSLYQPTLQLFQEKGILSQSTTHLDWNGNDLSSRKLLIESLPQNIVGKNNNIDNLASILASIVAPAARNQSFKGVFTLGLKKSLKYASAKLQKGLLRKK